MTQHTNVQSDLAHWLTWVDSVYADGYLMEMNSQGHRALFEVTRDPGMERNQASLEPERIQSMLSAFAGWRESRGNHAALRPTGTYAAAQGCGRTRLAVPAGSEP
jgi:hypothetical protein